MASATMKVVDSAHCSRPHRAGSWKFKSLLAERKPGGNAGGKGSWVAPFPRACGRDMRSGVGLEWLPAVRRIRALECQSPSGLWVLKTGSNVGVKPVLTLSCLPCGFSRRVPPCMG
jgi:hypothetical protein